MVSTADIRSLARKALRRKETVFRVPGGSPFKISTLTQTPTFPLAELTISLTGTSPEERATIDLGEGSCVTIGRTRSNILKINDPAIAKEHAVIRFEKVNEATQIVVENLSEPTPISYGIIPSGRFASKITLDQKIKPGKKTAFPANQEIVLLLLLSGKEPGVSAQRSLTIKITPIKPAEERAAELAAPQHLPQIVPYPTYRQGDPESLARLGQEQSLALTPGEQFSVSLQGTRFAQATTAVECVPILEHQTAVMTKQDHLSLKTRIWSTVIVGLGGLSVPVTSILSKYLLIISENLAGTISTVGVGLVMVTFIGRWLIADVARQKKKMELCAELAEKLVTLADKDIADTVRLIAKEADRNRLLEALTDANPVKAAAVKGLLRAPHEESQPALFEGQPSPVPPQLPADREEKQ